MTKLVTLLLAGAVLALAGCGDDDSGGGGSSGGGLAQCVKGMEATFKGKGEQICKCAESALKASSIKDDDKKKLLASFTTQGVAAESRNAYLKIMADCANKAK